MKHKAFKEQQRRIGVGAFTTGDGSVIVHQDCNNFGPICEIDGFFNDFETAVVIERAQEREIGEA